MFKYSQLRVIFVPLEITELYLETPLVVTTGERGAAEHITAHRTAPPTAKNDPAPDVRRAEAKMPGLNKVLLLLLPHWQG